MPPATGFEADLGRIRRRFRLVTTAMMLGAVALITAVVIGAMVVVDKRAIEAFKAEPGSVHAEQKRKSPANSSRTSEPRINAVGSAAANAHASDPRPVSRPATNGEAGPAPDTMQDTQQTARETRHHGRKRHRRRR